MLENATTIDMSGLPKLNLLIITGIVVLLNDYVLNTNFNSNLMVIR